MGQKDIQTTKGLKRMIIKENNSFVLKIEYTAKLDGAKKNPNGRGGWKYQCPTTTKERTINLRGSGRIH
jgi:hypothetical protein